jgi:hypothetical protein
MDFRNPYVESILPVGNGLKIQAGEINSNGDRSLRETVGGRDHYHGEGHRPRYRGPGAPLWERMERQHGQASCQRSMEGLSAYLIRDSSGQLNLRILREIFEDACGANTCIDSPLGGTTGAAGIAQTFWESTSTLQYKPFPSLITWAELRYDKSDKKVFLCGSRLANH